MIRSVDISRRDLLRTAGVGFAAAWSSGWFNRLAAETAADPRRQKSVILLWMNGGPATIDMWDLKPGHANGGPFQEIETAAPGVKISENLPKLAKWTKDMALIRSMTGKEGDHGRATQFAMTGYSPVGAIQFPAVGSLVAHEIGRENIDLPGFVCIAPARNGMTFGGGFLGPKYSPLAIGEEGGTLDGLKVPDLDRLSGVSATAQGDRLNLLNGLDKEFAGKRTSPVVAGLQSATTRAVRLMSPEAAGAFRIEDEKETTRTAYGRNLFGQGCLLARRLVERGVAFVEVTLGGWDTHQNNFERVKDLSGTLDNAFAALLGDLKERGLLQSTLVVCMGEFDRTPKINGAKGRDHWPSSWTAVMAGANVKGGQTVGKTSADGTTVEDRKTTVPDMIATMCKSLGIDPTKQNMSNVARPIRIADPSAKPIEGIV
ncbi:DUF1501 domain-containing protein [Zavarzinella formosa]|uniref:DUF1501 domain-containing protein n=1 Tax=Zavarzinella formosa TaxID=360055 RepID=UPI000314B42A|nr:DUF1501 domain-containing protein [Zavarzinella formosa]